MALALLDEIFCISIKKQIETNEDQEVSEKFKHLKPLEKSLYENKLQKKN